MRIEWEFLDSHEDLQNKSNLPFLYTFSTNAVFYLTVWLKLTHRLGGLHSAANDFLLFSEDHLPKPQLLRKFIIMSKLFLLTDKYFRMFLSVTAQYKNARFFF